MSNKADPVPSTPRLNAPVDPTRRRFLSNAAGLAAGGTTLGLMVLPPVSLAATDDPILDLIATYRNAAAAHLAALDEQTRLKLAGDDDPGLVSEAACHAEAAAFAALIETAPITFAGLVAWAAYLNEIAEHEAWMFEEAGVTLIETFADALGRLAETALGGLLAPCAEPV